MIEALLLIRDEVARDSHFPLNYAWNVDFSDVLEKREDVPFIPAMP